MALPAAWIGLAVLCGLWDVLGSVCSWDAVAVPILVRFDRECLSGWHILNSGKAVLTCMAYVPQGVYPCPGGVTEA